MGKNIKDLFNATAYDKAGEKLGSVKEVFVDEQSGQPTFVEVNHGLFGMSSSLVPLRGHDFTGDELKLAFSKDRIENAPDFDSDKPLTPEAQADIFKHYDLENAQDVTTYRDERDERAGVAGAGAGAHAKDETAATSSNLTNNEGEVIRSEERLDVNKERVATGEARLRKYVVTDTETVEVPVEREEVRVERTPISEADAANYTGTIGDNGAEEASVTLHEERVNVEKKTVPVEKVNLSKETIKDTETHTEDLRKEQIDTDGITETRK
ncbi:PRC and DUF2382 domain-containing protein [Corynebacterium aurimucosum]|uniref:PRC and DUF2382 domain-containing protein n=1 Tax=Corynebacterium aurimucosum TaxID=169292 RepID=UPI000C80B2DA|nr:PRC and DUF2382 domain-containing protein [Corynebacterium aurimucosum]PMC71735.1 photosystem reaction center subunit H [Corynebacterium aurimucosum]